MAQHTIHIDYDPKTGWFINARHEHHVKAKQQILWTTKDTKHNIQVSFAADPVINAPLQFSVPGTAQVIDNPKPMEHKYQVTVDGVSIEPKSAPGIIIE